MVVAIGNLVLLDGEEMDDWHAVLDLVGILIDDAVMLAIPSGTVKE